MTVLDDRAEALADHLHNASVAAAQLADARDQVTAVPRTNGQWLLLQRRARGWTGAQMARKLREAATSAGDKLPSRESLLVMIHRWESDRSGISERYRLHYCRALQIPQDWFGNRAALDLPASGTGWSGAGQTAGKHPGAGPSLAGDPAGLAGRLPAVRDRMHATVDQLCHDEDRDQFCFLLGYLCALVTALPAGSGRREPVNGHPAGRRRQP